MDTYDTIKVLIEGATLEEKLENALKFTETLEKENLKLRTELKKSEALIAKLHESLAFMSQNQNNTSSEFMLPSEFKSLWEKLVHENILDVFSPYISSPKTFIPLVQHMLKSYISHTTSHFASKLSSIQSLLNTPDSEKPKLHKCLLKFFQDHHSQIYPIKSPDQLKFLFTSNLTSPISSQFNTILKSSDFPDLLKTVHKISTFIALNDPQLELNFPLNGEIFQVLRPEDFYCIDGFPQMKSLATVVIPAVTRNSSQYCGIKPTILVVHEEVMGKSAENSHRSPLKRKEVARELTPSQALDLYTRFKQNFYKYKAQKSAGKSMQAIKSMKITEHVKKSDNPEPGHTKTMTSLNDKRKVEEKRKQLW